MSGGCHCWAKRSYQLKRCLKPQFHWALWLLICINPTGGMRPFFTPVFISQSLLLADVMVKVSVRAHCTSAVRGSTHQRRITCFQPASSSGLISCSFSPFHTDAWLHHVVVRCPVSTDLVTREGWANFPYSRLWLMWMCCPTLGAAKKAEPEAIAT